MLLNSELILDVIVSISLIAVFSTLNVIYSKYSSTEAIGYGDIKYIAVLTLVFTYLFSLVGLWVSALIAIPGSYFLKLLFTKLRDKERIPFGLFLSIGYLITSLIDGWLTNIYNIFILSYQC